jgi:hypothetical protein
MAEMWKPHPIDAYKKWIELIIKNEVIYNDWEDEFVFNIARRLESGESPTELQAKKLEQIYDRTP